MGLHEELTGVLHDVANQKRQTAKAKPISSNPLFPAVVALWFSALFGLGSLAVRPSLLESLVLKSHIDLVIPAAAPPLGVTARILLALVLAALGAMLGLMLTRRLTRPRPELHERKRGALDLAAKQPRVRSRDAHPDAPARRPISAHEELGGETGLASEQPPATGPGMLATRRRALAMIEEEPEFVPHDLAPLPGGAAIQPLDLANLALPENSMPPFAIAPLQTPAAHATSPLDWSHTAPVADEQLPAAAPAQLDPLPVATIEPLSAEAAHRDGRQVFGMAPPEPQPQAPRQIFGIVAEGDHLPQDFVKAAGFQTSVFDSPEASPLFVRPSTEATPHPAAGSIVSAAVPLPSTASLGMTDLAARLAESMRRRRERALLPLAAVVTEPTEQLADQTPATEAPEAALPAMPTVFTPIVADEPVGEPVLTQFTAAAPASAQPDFSAPLAMPAAMRPLALDAFLADDAAFDDGQLPPRHIAMPTPMIAPAAFAAPAAPVIAQFAVDQPDDDPANDDSLTPDSAGNPYASLLGLAPPRIGFVRIDEPAADAHEAPEPVVIFPGQAPRIAPVFAAAPATGEDTAFRRFDDPSSAGQGQPVAATSATAAVDQAEAARALRAALNNLQRMSGAA